MCPIQTNTKKEIASKKMLSFVFLSLILILLCFFIFLFSISSFEQSKVNAVGNSLKNALLSQKSTHPTQASFEANTVQVFHQTQIKNLFPDSSIKQNINGIFVSFNTSDIFKNASDELSSVANIWINRIRKLLTTSSLKQKYIPEFIFFEDLKQSEEYPIYQHLLTKRITRLANKLNDVQINDYSIRIEKGNSDKIILFFKQKEAQ